MARQRCPNGTRKRVCSVRGRDVTDCANPCASRKISQSKKVSALRKLLNEKDDNLQKLKTQEHRFKTAKKAYKTLKRQNEELFKTNIRIRRRVVKHENELQMTKSTFQQLQQDVPQLMKDYKDVTAEKDRAINDKVFAEDLLEACEKDVDRAIDGKKHAEHLLEQCKKEFDQKEKAAANSKAAATLRKKYGKGK